MMGLSNYPPGFGSPRDLDHVEGPVAEEDIDESCPDCDDYMVRITWHASATVDVCVSCDYEREAQEIEPW